MQLATVRPGGGIAWRILVLLHFILAFGYRGKVLLPAISFPTVVLSCCIFFGIAFVCLPFNVKSATRSHGQYVLIVPCCFRRSYDPLLLALQKSPFGTQSKGSARWPPRSLPAQITLWRRHLAPSQAGERWIHTWVAGRQVMGDVLCVGWWTNLRGAGSSLRTRAC